MGNGISKRKLSDWLETYISYTEEQESPELFHLWTGVSSIAAVLERNVYLDRGIIGKLYPNLYIILTGASAVDRKTSAINIGEDFVREACPDINFISQKIIPEAFIEALQTCYELTGVGCGYVIAEELSYFLGTSEKSSALIHLLTKAYSCPNILNYHTKGRGVEVVSDVCINFLGATTTEWLKKSLPKESIQGGWAGRHVFVYAHEPWNPVAHPEMTVKMVKQRDNLMFDLARIRELKGEFVWSKDAKEWFRVWYEEVFKPDEQDFLLEGYYGRKGHTILKIAMILSVSNNPSLILEEVDVKNAIRILGETEKMLPQIMQKLDSTQIGEDLHWVLSLIEKKGPIGYSPLLRKVGWKLSPLQLQDILSSLILQEFISEKGEKGKRGNLRIFRKREET